jgi:hypothetical protein
VLVTAVIVPVFNVVTDRPTVRAAVQGLVDAVIISTLVGGYLLLVREGVLRDGSGGAASASISSSTAPSPWDCSSSAALSARSSRRYSRVVC